jgi:RNA polymerase sigma-70 factor (ECF subfamily)
MTAGVQEEFARFWKHTRDRVRAYMLCACSDRSDADDLAQECYLRALRSWDRFDGTGSRKAWLFAIARNTRADWFRKRFKETRVSEVNAETEAAEMSLQADLDDVELVWRAVEGLESEHREVIHLRFAADLSYMEIAGMLNVPVGTVRSRLHRGLKAVRERIKEREDER